MKSEILKIRMKVYYIDPGTGGMIIGSLWGMISYVAALIAAFIAAYFLRPLKKFLKKLLRVFRANRVYAVVILILIFITILWLGGGGFVCRNKTETAKVLVIGIDAMDPRIVENLMVEGKLPNFEKLKKMGTYARLKTTIPPETPVAWSAAATGSNPGKYGIFDFLGRNKKTYEPKLNLAKRKEGLLGTSYQSAMKGKPFWRITSEQGIETTVIRWPLTFPPERVNGRMLSGLGVPDIRGFLNSYSFYTEGDEEEKPGDTGRVVKVKREGKKIETYLYGPFVRSGNEVREAKTPMRIMLFDDYITIETGEKKYEVREKGWSEWARMKFTVDFLREVYGIFKVYLFSMSPLRMYVTSVQIDPENPVVDITYPKDYGRELAKEIGLFYTLGIPEDTKAVTEGRMEKRIFLEQIGEIEKERERMFWHEFGRFKSGVYAFGFDSNDRLQHIFWGERALEKEGDEIEIPKEVEDYYMGKDRFLGKLLEKMDNETHLIIFSDHGFTSFEKAVTINTWLVKNGYMVLTKNISEITNKSNGLFRYVDWNRTKAYSLGFASIYINLKGREGKGIVKGGEKGKLIDEIMGKLSGLSDPENGNKVIAKLYKGEEVYSGPYAEESPDIVVGFRPGYRMSWQNAVGGVTEWVVKANDNEWKGDHLVERDYVPGVLFTNFKIRKQNPDIMDIAPTVLSLIGLEVPREMDGESLV